MSETILNEAEWAEYSAARLKAVWVDFAEAAPEQRAQYLKEELSRAIKPIPGGYRKNYLGRLRMKFPAFAPAAAQARAGRRHHAGGNSPLRGACPGLAASHWRHEGR